MGIATKDRIKGALYGFAIGDAMGATTEFMDVDSIKMQYGQVTDIIGGGRLHLEAGQVTDDTQMSMCVMGAIETAMKYIDDPEYNIKSVFKNACADNFIKWYMSKPPDVGGQCRSAIVELIRGQVQSRTNMFTAGRRPLGNGSLMRALPCALINNLEWNLVQGRLTHNDKLCDDCIRYYNKLVNGLLGKYDWDWFPYVSHIQHHTGHVVETLNNAIYWASKPTFEECIVGVVNDGGDSDTIGAISGSLAGLRFGYQDIPEKWILTLDMKVRTVLDNFAEYVWKYRGEESWKKF